MPLLWPSDSRQRPFEVLASASGVGLFAGILDTFPGLDNAGHAAINRGSAERLFARFATETTAMGGPGIDSPERFAIKKKIGGGDPPSRDACRCRHQTERGAHEHLSPADMGCCVRRGSSSGRSLAGDHAGLGWHHLRHGERRQSGERQRHDRLRRRELSLLDRQVRRHDRAVHGISQRRGGNRYLRPLQRVDGDRPQRRRDFAIWLVRVVQLQRDHQWRKQRQPPDHVCRVARRGTVCQLDVERPADRRAEQHDNRKRSL